MLALPIFATGTFFLDQITKRAAQARFAAPLGGRFLRIRTVHHLERIYCRGAFRAALVIIWCGAAIAAVWLHKFRLVPDSGVALAGLGCALGGAAGNLLDILHRRYVIDFIDLGWWPVFNLADVAIVAGLLLAFSGMVPRS